MKKVFLALLISCISLMTQEIIPLDTALGGELSPSIIAIIQDLEIIETIV